MAGEAIQVGPFNGGLNTFSDVTAIADNELSVCENFELDLDGSLVSRPPFVYRNIDFPLQSTGNINVLGYFYGPGSVPYLIASDGVSKTYYFNGSAWTLITSTFAATSMVQYDYKAWLLAPVGSANPGGTWNPSAGFVAQANMPKGDVIVAYKERVWVAAGKDATTNPTRLYYSNPLGSATFWQVSPDFIDIGTGDGESIVRVVVYYNSLLIFRTNSIYSFQFTSDPISGVQSLVVPNIGLTHRKALISWENFIYFMYDERAYEFINNRANQINVKVPFESASRTGIYQPYSVSLYNNRIIFSFWDTMYVFSTRTRTWTTWKSTVFGAIGEFFVATVDTEFVEAVAFSSVTVGAGASRVAKTLHITDAITNDAEAFTCIAQTKNYNYQASSAYKRLFWWGVDAIFRSTLKAYAVPVTFSQSVLWSQLATYTWGQMAAYTWGQPTSPTTAVETVRDTTGLGSVRKFVKFMKSLRFRQIYYRLEFDTDGSINSAPVRLFSLMTYVRAHQRVSKTVT